MQFEFVEDLINLTSNKKEFGVRLTPKNTSGILYTPDFTRKEFILVVMKGYSLFEYKNTIGANNKPAYLMIPDDYNYKDILEIPISGDCRGCALFYKNNIVITNRKVIKSMLSGE